MNTHQHDHGTGQHPPDDPPGGHGMVVLGTGTVFLSHLPMFMPVHDYQVILEAEFVGGDGLPQEEYVEDRKSHPDQLLYTLKPRPFVLPDILPQGARPPRLASFGGGVHRNHFERPGTSPEEIAQDVEVRVRNVVHGRKFDVAAVRPGDLSYVVFGRGAEVYLAHLISRPPDFDQLIQVRIDHDLSDEELGLGLLVTVPDRADSSAERIRPTDGKVPATLRSGDSDIAMMIEPGAEFYFEEGELEKAM